MTVEPDNHVARQKQADKVSFADATGPRPAWLHSGARRLPLISVAVVLLVLGSQTAPGLAASTPAPPATQSFANVEKALRGLEASIKAHLNAATPVLTAAEANQPTRRALELAAASISTTVTSFEADPTARASCFVDALSKAFKPDDLVKFDASASRYSTLPSLTAVPPTWSTTLDGLKDTAATSAPLKTLWTSLGQSVTAAKTLNTSATRLLTDDAATVAKIKDRIKSVGTALSTRLKRVLARQGSVNDLQSALTSLGSSTALSAATAAANLDLVGAGAGALFDSLDCAVAVAAATSMIVTSPPVAYQTTIDQSAKLSPFLTGPVTKALVALKPAAEALIRESTALAAETDKIYRAVLEKAGTRDEAAASSLFVDFGPLQRECERRRKSMTLTIDALDRIAVLFPQSSGRGALLGAPKSDLSTSIAAVPDVTRRLKKAWTDWSAGVSRTDTMLLGDRSGWVFRHIPLYYFDDIPRLMRALAFETDLTVDPVKTIGGSKALRDAATKSSEALTQGTLDLATAQHALGLKQAVQRENNEKDARERAGLIARKSEIDTERDQRRRSVQRLQNSSLESDVRLARLNRQKARLDPSDSADQAALARLDKSILDEAESKARVDEELSLLDKDEIAASAEATAIATDMATLDKRVSGDAALMTDAKDELRKSVANIEQKKREAFVNAGAEALAFALARDNLPFYYLPPIAVHRDPVRRCFIYGFSDSKGLFVRGRAADVAEVERLVLDFDKPEPQAALTLWTIQISYEASNLESKRRREFESANKALEAMQDEMGNARRQVDAAVALFRRSVEDAVRLASLPPALKTTDGHPFISSAVRKMLSIARVTSASGGNPVPVMIDIDPHRTLSLAESLMVLALGRPDWQSVVRRLYEDRIVRSIAQVTPLCTDVESAGNLPSLWANLGVPSAPRYDPTTRTDDDSLTALQFELASVLKGLWIRRGVDEAGPLISEFRRVKRLKDSHPDDLSELRFGTLKPVLMQSGALLAIDEVFRGDLGLSQSGSIVELLEMDQFDEVDEVLASPLFRSRFSNRLGVNKAREAVLNDRFKELIKAVDDDLKRAFIMPALHRLRGKLRKAGVEVGTIEESSILAMDRRMARVETRALSNLSMGTDDDAIGAVQSLAQIYGAVAAGALPGILDSLRGAEKMEPKRRPAVYGITSGAPFVVTPVLDPSGQALSFQLDYVHQNFILEPDGSVDPQLTRVQHHTVNSKVQLSNFEVRQVSQYQFDGKLGLREDQRGGIPVLREMWPLSKLPLVGWFTRRRGRAAVVHWSVVFAHSTIFPTVGSMAELITPANN